MGLLLWESRPDPSWVEPHRPRGDRDQFPQSEDDSAGLTMKQQLALILLLLAAPVTAGWWALLLWLAGP